MRDTKTLILTSHSSTSNKTRVKTFELGTKEISTKENVLKRGYIKPSV